MSKPVPDTPLPIPTGAVALSRSAAARIAAATRKIEGFPTIGGALPPGLPRSGLVPLYYAKVTTQVSARSSTTVGTGAVTLYYLPSGSNTLTATSLTGVAVANVNNKTIAVNDYCIVGWVSGRWAVIVPGDCADVA